MQYGLELPNMCPNGDAQALVELACLAEEAGWDGVFKITSFTGALKMLQHVIPGLY